MTRAEYVVIVEEGLIFLVNEYIFVFRSGRDSSDYRTVRETLLRNSPEGLE